MKRVGIGQVGARGVGPRRAASVALMVACIVGCDAPLDADIERQRVIATIEDLGMPVMVELPDTVVAGELFEVHVHTYGGGCVDKGDTEVEVLGPVASVTPYDIEVTRLPENHYCPDILLIYDHVGLVRLTQGGPAMVEVRGRRRPGNEVFTVERPVYVR